MLILSRRPGESVVIGNQVTVTVLDVRGDQIRIGVDAPREVQVHREEVHVQLQSENTGAAASSARARDAVARLSGTRRATDRGPDDAEPRESDASSPGDDPSTSEGERDGRPRRDRPFRPPRSPGDA